MSKPSSPLKVKVKSPKNPFAKNRKKKSKGNNTVDNSPPSTSSVNKDNNMSAATSNSTHGSTKSDNTNCSEQEYNTPTLSNTARKLNSNGLCEFPTLPDLMGENDNDHHVNTNDNGDDDDDDDESVAAMSDLQDNNSLDNNSLNDSYVSDVDYYKQDYYIDDENTVDAGEGGEADIGKTNDGVGVKKGTNNITLTEQVVVATKDYDGDGSDGNIVDNTTRTPRTTPRRDNTGITATEATSPSSIKSFDSNIKTPPHLLRIDLFATTPDRTNGNDAPMTPLELLQTPGGSTNAPKVLKQNKKLRAGRKELLKMLGSTAKQFSKYEEVASQKIFELEERIRKMEKEQQQQQQKKTNTNGDGKKDLVVALSNEIKLNGVVTAAAAPDAAKSNLTEDKRKHELKSNNEPKTTSFEDWAERSSYDPETVRNLSNEIMEQQKQVYMKEKLISSLKLRCETLKHCLSENEDELEQSKKAWGAERLKLLDKLQADSPMRRDHGEVLSVKMQNKQLKNELDCALNDVDMLSNALEKNNEALDHSVSQLERLRKWKIEHDQMEEELRAVCGPMQPIEEEKPGGDEEEAGLRKESELDSKRSGAAMTELEEVTIIEKEQQIETLEGGLKEKGLEIVQLQTDLDSCFKEIEDLKEMVNKTAAAKGYEDFQSMVENLQDEAIKSEIKATAFNERISELESELQAKNTEIVQIRMSNEDGPKSFVEQGESDDEAPPHETVHLRKCNNEMESKSYGLLSSPGNDSVGATSPSPGSSSHDSSSPGASPTESRRWSAGLSFAKKLAKEGRQYAAAVGHANDPETMLGMVRERDRKINSLETTIESNTLMIEKLKKDVERMDTEHEEALMHSTQRIEQLEEENAVYLHQVEGFEKAFMTLNESQQTTLLPSLDDDEARTPDESVESDKDDEASSEEESEDLKSQNAKLERMLSDLRDNSSFQEDQIEKLKTELTTLRVVSQQDKESACDKLRDENKIMEAQRSALENELVDINRSAALLRDSLIQDSTLSPSKSKSEGDDQAQNIGQVGSDPILVAQVVMLENANKVLGSSVINLRSGQQEILAPLLERIALLEEEKRIMEEEMHTKIHCREQTISNLEDSLKQATQSRLTKKKKTSALKLSEQLLARATKAASD